MVDVAQITITLPADVSRELAGFLLGAVEDAREAITRGKLSPGSVKQLGNVVRTFQITIAALQEAHAASQSPREGATVDQGSAHANGGAGVPTGAATDAPPAL